VTPTPAPTGSPLLPIWRTKTRYISSLLFITNN